MIWKATPRSVGFEVAMKTPRTSVVALLEYRLVGCPNGVVGDDFGITQPRRNCCSRGKICRSTDLNRTRCKQLTKSDYENWSPLWWYGCEHRRDSKSSHG